MLFDGPAPGIKLTEETYGSRCIEHTPAFVFPFIVTHC
jgi:hypothetical protein